MRRKSGKKRSSHRRNASTNLFRSSFFNAVSTLIVFLEMEGGCHRYGLVCAGVLKYGLCIWLGYGGAGPFSVRRVGLGIGPPCSLKEFCQGLYMRHHSS